TWDPDTRVSTASQDLNVGLPPGSGGAAGDYWGIDTTQDTVYVAWNDTRNGVDQDIYVAKGLLSSGGGGTATPTLPASNTPTATATPTQTSTTVATVPSGTETPWPSSTRTSSATVTPPGTVTACSRQSAVSSAPRNL